MLPSLRALVVLRALCILRAPPFLRALVVLRALGVVRALAACSLGVLSRACSWVSSPTLRAKGALRAHVSCGFAGLRVCGFAGYYKVCWIVRIFTDGGFAGDF